MFSNPQELIRRVMEIVGGNHQIKIVSSRSREADPEGGIEFDGFVEFSPGIEVPITLHLQARDIERLSRLSDAEGCIGA